MPAWSSPWELAIGRWGDPWGLLTLLEAEIVATVPYCDEIEAQAYFNERLGASAWDDADSADQLKGLKMATRLIDTLCFIGRKYDPSQEREFPRDVTDEVTALGDIPQTVKDACAEITLALLKGLDPEDLISATGITSEAVGDASRSYADRGRQAILDENEGVPSVIAGRLLREWICDPRMVDLDRVG